MSNSSYPLHLTGPIRSNYLSASLYRARSARQARRRPRRGGPEDDPREPGAYGKGGYDVAWPLGFRVREKAEAPSPFRFAVRSCYLRQRLARTAYTNILNTTIYICKCLAHEAPQSPFRFSVVLCLFLVISDFGESRKKIFLLAFCSVLGLMFGVLMMCLFVIT